MRKLVAIIAVLLGLSGCQIFFPTDPTIDLPEGVIDLESAFIWVGTNVTYKSDQDVWGQEDYWQSPDTTMKIRTGDCEDFAILFSSMAVTLEYNSEILVTDNGKTKHAISRIDGVVYDVTPYLGAFGFCPPVFLPCEKLDTVVSVLSMQEALYRCKYMYNN